MQTYCFSFKKTFSSAVHGVYLSPDCIKHVLCKGKPEGAYTQLCIVWKQVLAGELGL